MPCIDAPEKFALFNADGGSDGIINISDNTGWFIHAEVWVWSDTKSQALAHVTELVGSDSVRVRLVPTANKWSVSAGDYCKSSDMSGYTVADSAKIAMPPQVVRVEMAYTKPTSV